MRREADVTGVIGLRLPTQAEAEGIAAFTGAYYASRIRLGRGLSSVLSVLGAAFCFMYEQAGIAMLVFALICFALVFVVVYDKRSLSEKAAVYAQRRYLVLDGVVSRLQGSPELGGVCNAWVVTRHGQALPRMFRVLKNHAGSTMPVIVACAPDHHGINRAVWAFTPYMLTAEGARNHW